MRRQALRQEIPAAPASSKRLLGGVKEVLTAPVATPTLKDDPSSYFTQAARALAMAADAA